jgi:hypothetical protein
MTLLRMTARPGRPLPVRSLEDTQGPRAQADRLLTVATVRFREG